MVELGVISKVRTNNEIAELGARTDVMHKALERFVNELVREARRINRISPNIAKNYYMKQARIAREEATRWWNIGWSYYDTSD